MSIKRRDEMTVNFAYVPTMTAVHRKAIGVKRIN
jgi:hypothetical protein